MKIPFALLVTTAVATPLGAAAIGCSDDDPPATSPTPTTTTTATTPTGTADGGTSTPDSGSQTRNICLTVGDGDPAKGAAGVDGVIDQFIGKVVADCAINQLHRAPARAGEAPRQCLKIRFGSCRLPGFYAGEGPAGAACRDMKAAHGGSASPRWTLRRAHRRSLAVTPDAVKTHGLRHRAGVRSPEEPDTVKNAIIETRPRRPRQERLRRQRPRGGPESASRPEASASWPRLDGGRRPLVGAWGSAHPGGTSAACGRVPARQLVLNVAGGSAALEPVARRPSSHAGRVRAGTPGVRSRWARATPTWTPGEDASGVVPRGAAGALASAARPARRVPGAPGLRWATPPIDQLTLRFAGRRLVGWASSGTRRLRAPRPVRRRLERDLADAVGEPTETRGRAPGITSAARRDYRARAASRTTSRT